MRAPSRSVLGKRGRPGRPRRGGAVATAGAVLALRRRAGGQHVQVVRREEAIGHGSAAVKGLAELVLGGNVVWSRHRGGHRGGGQGRDGWMNAYHTEFATITELHDCVAAVDGALKRVSSRAQAMALRGKGKERERRT